MRSHRLVGSACIEVGGDCLGRAEQAGGTLTGRISGLGDDQVGARIPDDPPLGPEQAVCLTPPLYGGAWVSCGQGGGGSREQQLCSFVRDPFALRCPAKGGLSLCCRFCRQPGSQQSRAAVDGELGVGLAERFAASACLVEVGKRFGQVAAGQGGQPAVAAGLGVFEFLSAGREQFLGPGEIRARPPGEAEPEKDLGPPGQRPGLPYRVAGPAEIGQGAAQVLVRLVKPAQVFEDGGAPHEHPPG